ncbi:tRNA (adenosine(37)-N6)-threonylcarbamoyltransferase complex dimerization subunit type 1 TsaB [bacterium]|nr:tRNA (adenosine(37)-N6)-threonylcarbamoyltransferase complex dimerization subunit type 1 TsaB [bacterium]
MACFAVSIGPGSFTGLRVGLTAVKTMAYFLKKPIIPVSTLMSLALAAGPVDIPVAAILDARKDEVFGAYFSVGNSLKRLTKDCVLPIEEFIKNRPADHIHLIGNGIAEYKDRIERMDIIFSESPENVWEPSPVTIGRIAIQYDVKTIDGEAIFRLAPVYLRRCQAELNWEKKFGLK